jgi:hypothetical protein
MRQVRHLPRLAAAALVAYAWVASVAAQTPEGSGSATNQTTIWVTSLIGFFSLMATQIFSLWREARNRKWDLEDRAHARAQMQKAAELQRIETIQTAIQLAKVTTAHSEQIVKEISKNTALTKSVGDKADAAYGAANNFTERLDRLRQELESKGPQIDNIEKISGDTNDKVTELAEGTESKAGK